MSESRTLYEKIMEKLPRFPMEDRVSKLHKGICEEMMEVVRGSRVFSKTFLLTLAAAVSFYFACKLGGQYAGWLKALGYVLGIASVVIAYAVYDVIVTLVRNLASVVFFKYEYETVVRESVQFHYERLCGDNTDPKELEHLQAEFSGDQSTETICRKIMKPR